PGSQTKRRCPLPEHFRRFFGAVGPEGQSILGGTGPSLSVLRHLQSSLTAWSLPGVRCLATGPESRNAVLLSERPAATLDSPPTRSASLLPAQGGLRARRRGGLEDARAWGGAGALPAASRPGRGGRSPVVKVTWHFLVGPFWRATASSERSATASAGNFKSRPLFRENRRQN